MKINDTTKRTPSSVIRRRIVTAAVAVVFAAIGGVYVWQKLPASVKNPPPAPTNPSTPVIGGTTAPTRATTYYDQWYLPTEESDWHSTEETVIWNDCYSFTFTEPPKVSKTLPDDIKEINYYLKDEITDKNGTLISNHIYVECQLKVDYIKEQVVTLYDISHPGGNIASGNQAICIYDRSGKHFTEYMGNRKSIMFVNGKQTDYHCSAYLSVGDTVELQLIFIIDENTWNNADNAVLLTPQFSMNDVDQMQRMGYTQPHFLLNTAPFAAE